MSFRLFNNEHGGECKEEPLGLSQFHVSTDGVPDVFFSFFGLYLGSDFNIYSRAECRIFSRIIHSINSTYHIPLGKVGCGSGRSEKGSGL